MPSMRTVKRGATKERRFSLPVMANVSRIPGLEAEPCGGGEALAWVVGTVVIAVGRP